MSGAPSTIVHHLVTLRVENRAGVLVRVAGLFARRGYNIVSLAVAPTEDARFSRISIVVDVESAPLGQIVEQLDKLVNVVEIVEMAPDQATESELLLATVTSPAASLEEVLAGTGAEIVDSSGTNTTVRLTASPEELDRFADALFPYGISELQRTGRIALPKLT
ncbi:MAG TPA: acetolactate synthase small subunit [Acidimicrobiales bacterium]|nr:acetolactate synthase small subunit [Acidimicrobiales bacterium]